MSSKNTLTCQEICDIIKQCGESGVSEFNARGLKLTFKAKAQVIESSSFDSQDSEGLQEKYEAPFIVANEENAIKQAELIQKEEQLMSLHVGDPEHYEDLLATGKIDDVIMELEEENNA